ncbi:hypothetical protein [Levilactobacillus wangkuiensis]|uniref:hypothetical protein n=1 Tax=Levilactobacillus wangkuiensis TaxID=2799566 RepID=UPI001944B24D|nr:hypothetical protein [Levilactobacillus wangkuiensis]
MLNTLIGLSFMIFLGLLILWYTGRRRQNPSKITGRHVLYSLALVVVLISISSAIPSSTSESNSSEAESSSVNSTASSSAKETENDILAGYSAKELKSYNSGLIDSLNEDQDYANKGKTKYNASLYIDTLGYDSRGLIVKVTSEFSSLDKDSKTAVGQYAQNLANAQVVIQGDSVDEESTPTTQIYYGSKKIGHSKLTNGIEFKWNKS